MFKRKRIIFLIAETPLHPGSGSETGIVDLPIQRERHTEFPKIESSALKGCIREAFESSNPELEVGGRKVHAKDKVRYKENGTERETDYISLVFGPEEGEHHAGAFAITDARILLFPVKSLKGVFAWITCPFVLERFKRDMEMAGVNINQIGEVNFSSLENTVSSSEIVVSGKVVLEEFAFDVRENEDTKKLSRFFSDIIFSDNKFWKEKLQKNLVVLSDDDFTQFVKTSTEVVTRTKIDDETGTVKEGALWTEEYLPQDTVMYSIVMFSALRVVRDEQKGVFKTEDSEEEAKRVEEFFVKGIPEVIQIGGNQTIGKGFVRVRVFP